MSAKICRYLMLVLILALAACASPTPAPTEQAAPTAAPAAEKYIVFGDISDDPAEVIEGAQPIVEYLAAKLKDYGITGGQVKVVASTEEMVELLKNGDVDFYFDSTYPATLISDDSGGQIVLRRWKFGVETYNSIIFASKESGIKSIEDLKGKMVAMDAPYSTSGFMLPVVYLTENGLKLVGKASNSDPVAPDEVGFAFAYDDQNVMQWVLDGLTPAGVTDDYNFDKAFPPEAREKFIELARTEKTPRQVAVVGPKMDANLLKEIVKILIVMDEDPAAAEALDSFQTTQFDEFPEGIEAAMKRIREMQEIVKDIPLP
jgi:phosphonate transport system substrate-binding protein